MNACLGVDPGRDQVACHGLSAAAGTKRALMWIACSPVIYEVLDFRGRAM